jgi:hypothetical protein
MANQTFANITDEGIVYSNIQAVEADVGVTLPWIPTTVADSAVTGATGIQWLAINTAVYYASSNETINLSYTATDTNVGELIDSCNQLYAVDLNSGSGVSLTAVQKAFDTFGNLLATNTFSLAGGQAASTFLFAQKVVNMQVTITLAVNAAGTNASMLGISSIQETNGVIAASSTASIGGFSFIDNANNGIYGTGDVYLPGETVALLNSTGTSVLAYTTTNASGAYTFSGLTAGSYEVKFLPQAGFGFSKQVTGNLAVDSAVVQATGITAPITVVAGQTYTGANAGFVPGGSGGGSCATIGNTVWLDANGDGLLNNGETGVAGVTVDLLNAAGTSILAVTTTNASGNYQFANLSAGTYEVQVIKPIGDIFTIQNVALTGGATIDSTVAASTGITAPITLTAGQTYSNANAGLEVDTGQIGMTVFLDNNRDGLYDAGDAAAVGVTVQLLNGTGTSVLATTSTSPTGTYIFTSLLAGTYEVKVLAPTGEIFTTQNVALANGATVNSQVNSTGVTAPITLTAGQTYVQANAGLETPPSSIGSTVWLDSNKDGLLNGTETKVAGVTVNLLNGTGTSVLATTTTSASGTYNFGNLNAGVYEVQFLAPAGDKFTTANVALTGGATVDSTANATTGITAPITLAAGQNYTNANAGLTITPTPSISVLKLPGSMVVNKNGSVTYTFNVTNTGNTALTNVCIKDNIGTASKPVYVTPTLVTTGTNGTLGVGQTWVYQETLNMSGSYCGYSDYKGSCGYGGYSGCNTTDVGNAYCGGYGNYGSYSGCGGYGSSSCGYGYSSYSNCGSLNEYEVSSGNTGFGACSDGSGNYSYYCTQDGSLNNCGYTGCGFQYGNGFETSEDFSYGCGGSNYYGYYGYGCGSSGYGGGYYSNCCYSGCGGGGCGGGGGGQYGTNIMGAADTVTVSAQALIPGSSGSCAPTNCATSLATGGYLTSGNTAWLSSSFRPTSCANGATYNFHGVTCTITPNSGSQITVKCPDSKIVFSDNCWYPTTTFDAVHNCWTTTLPSNCNPGNVFLTGCPSTIANGVNLTNAKVTWTIGGSDNNCGATSINWNGTCRGYTGFNTYGDYNNIGVESCDNQGDSCSAGTPWYQDWGSNCGNSNLTDYRDDAAHTCGSTPTQNCSTTVTVSATDTKEVMILGCNSNVTIGGTATTASLAPTYGAAKTLEFTYTPGNTVSLAQIQANMAGVLGTNSNTLAFVEISNKANPYTSGATIYFEGMVQSGEKIYADATTNVLTNTPIAGGAFSTTAGANIYAYVFANETDFLAGKAPVQTMSYNTSGSQAMHFGDTVGSLQLIGYVGTTGGRLV